MQTHRAKRRIIQIAMLLAGAFGLAAVISGTQTSAVAVPTENQAADYSQGDDDVAMASGKPKEGDIRGHRRILLVTYHVVKDCKVNANYPINPGNRTWTVRAGAKIIWRYNVTGKVAAVSDPTPGKKFPHWGFVEDNSCIGKSVGQKGHYEVYHNGKWVRKDTPPIPAGLPMPRRVLSGRSQFEPFWLDVDWRPSHGAIPSAHHKMTHNRTLRDAPHRFVIGNVFDDWTVRPTTVRKDGYTKVYVPSLHRWGWLQL